MELSVAVGNYTIRGMYCVYQEEKVLTVALTALAIDYCAVVLMTDVVILYPFLCP